MTASPTDDLASAERKIQELTKELSRARGELVEALEQQAATGGILTAISNSPTDLQGIFQKIATTAARLCDAYDAGVLQCAGDNLRLVAHRGQIPGQGIVPLSRGVLLGRAILDRTILQVPDLQAETEEYPEGSEIARRLGHRTIVAVPLIRDQDAIGAIFVRRTEARPFTDRQIELLKTFADQAVIAIENTRLFEEVQQKNRALMGANAQLSEALEQQTATADILRVISSSPTDVEPVLDAVAKNAAHLCMANDAQIYVLKDNRLVLGASHGLIPPFGTRELSRGWVTGRAVIDCRTIHVHDLAAEAEAEYPVGREAQRLIGHRTTLATPLLRKGAPLGAVLIRRMEVRPFSERQIKLLETFADQAAIAIENTRLFEAEQASKRELTEALEYQTATSKVLSVIGSSPGDLAPVFDAMLTNAVRICEAKFGVLFRYDGNVFQPAATLGVPAAYTEFLQERGSFRPTPGAPIHRLVQTKELVHITDNAAEQYPGPAGKYGGARSLIAVPMRKEKELVGAFVIYRTEVRPFTDKQIELVKGFANQAVIAIENVRLLNELRESLQQQTATADVLNVISRSKFDRQPVFDAIVQSGLHLFSDDAVLITLPKGNLISAAAVAAHDPTRAEAIRKRFPVLLTRDYMHGIVILDKKVVDIPDGTIVSAELSTGARAFLGSGNRAITIVPLMRGEHAIGTLGVLRRAPGPLSVNQLELLKTFADQAVIAIENTRLFEEVQARTRELAKTVEDLEIASQHKNQFVANMSHELRTPLAAILGYGELIQEGFYGALPEKSLNALTRIRSNGKHLLGLINTVLDIAKIESGQFTLNMTEYAIESVVETVRAATESLAQNKKLTLTTSVDKSLPVGLGDEQRLTQVLLNLVGNAIKFTDAGEVRVTAKAINGHFNVSVTDTGPGIPPEHQTRIFEQFQQVDNSNTRAKGGTGLGLAIAKQIVEMHGGRIWVESSPGKGSTFQMELPTRAEFHKRI